MDGSTKSGLAGTCSQQDFTQWLLPNLSVDELRSCSRPGAICILPVGTKMAIKETFRLYTLHSGMFTSLKSSIVMTHDQNNN